MDKSNKNKDSELEDPESTLSEDNEELSDESPKVKLEETSKKDSEEEQEEETEEVEEEKKAESEPESQEEDEIESEESQEDEKTAADIKFQGFNPNEDNNKIFYEPPKRNKSMKKFIIWLIILAILALIIGFFATSTFKGSSEKKVAESSPVPVTTPTPTPELPQLVRSEISFEVLNGSGITGQAKKIADAIEELGYKVVKTGNADKQSYEESQIFVSEDLKEKIDLIVADLKDVIRIATVSGELKDSTPSAKIIIGKDSE